jgi:solute carrier family 35 protein
LDVLAGLICGPILILWTLLSGELNMAINFESLHVLGFQVVTALSCIIAFCLNYTIFLNTTLNSALTQTMCGNLKDLGTVFFGWICFGGLPFDWLNVFGQFLGFLGSGMYAYCTLKGK